MAGTAYLVFKQIDIDEPGEGAATGWVILDELVAPGADGVKQQAAVKYGDGTYAAVPTRSWQPTSFKVEPRAVAVKEQT